MRTVYNKLVRDRAPEISHRQSKNMRVGRLINFMLRVSLLFRYKFWKSDSFDLQIQHF